MIEYVDHLHEHFLERFVVRDGRYRLPRTQGYSAQMRAETLDPFAFPDGAEWQLSAMDGSSRSRISTPVGV